MKLYETNKNKKMNILRGSGKTVKKLHKYLMWNCVTNIVCGTEVVVSTHSMLGALSIDNHNSDLYSVTSNLMGKEIIGQVLGIPIINKLSKIGDSNTKRFILINTILFEVSNLLECSTSLFDKSYFIYLATLGNIGKGAAFIGMGGINAKVINRISNEMSDEINKKADIENNLDIKVKTVTDNVCNIYSTVSVCTSLSYSIGMIIGLCIVKVIPCHQTRLGLIPLFGVIKYYTTMKSLDGII